jgi:acyl-CoA-binding protein
LSDKLKLKLYAIYKQATCGDNATKRPFDAFKRTRWDAWRAYKGTEKAPAMRR